MSQLENQAKPIVERLLDGSQVTLNVEEQLILARWAIKNAMVFETLRSDQSWFYSVDERASVSQGSALPARTGVWIAKCVNLPGMYFSASDLSESAAKGPNEARAYVTTMGFGGVAIQVVTAKVPDSVPAGVTVTATVRPGPWEDVTIRIWPNSAAVTWPPSVGLNGELGLETLGARWRPLDPD